MAEEASEQKSLPASDKKLRDARRKGQVSHSKDLLSGFGLLAMCLYLLLTWDGIRDRVIQLVDTVARAPGQPFSETWRLAVDAAAQAVWQSTVPAVAVLVLTIVVVGIAGTFGPVLSFENVKPNFDHVNPVSGLKRIFSIRNVMELVKGLLKIVVLGTVLFLVLRTWIQPLFEVPACGAECLGPTLLAAMKPIIAVAAFSFIIIGLADVALQRWLFLRDMRMTKTELKRERKDIEGDPLIRSERSRVRRSLATMTSKLGLSAAVFVVCSKDEVVGVRFHRTHTPVPIVVCRTKGAENAHTMRMDAFDRDIAVIDNPKLAEDLHKQHGTGDMVRREHFAEIANILVANNLV